LQAERGGGRGNAMFKACPFERKKRTAALQKGKKEIPSEIVKKKGKTKEIRAKQLYQEGGADFRRGWTPLSRRNNAVNSNL